MSIIRIIFLFFILYPSIFSAQEKFRLAYYDMGSLYDTIPNAQKEILGFTTTGKYRWNSYKYWTSIKQLKLITDSLSNPSLPSLFIISGLENESVVKDVVRKISSSKERYYYRFTEHKSSPTQTVLLYQRDQFKVLSFSSIELEEENFTAKDYNLFYTKGKLICGDTLHVLSCRQVNDNDLSKTELQYHRCYLAKVLAKKINNIFQENSDPNIVLIGDFLDPPNAKTIISCLKAKEIDAVDSKLEESKSLYNLFPSSRLTEEGTYKDHVDWYIYDQVFVSRKLFDSISLVKLAVPNGKILFSPFLLQKDIQYGGLKPFSMYNCTYFQKGSSNHLPIYVDLFVADE